MFYANGGRAMIAWVHHPRSLLLLLTGNTEPTGKSTRCNQWVQGTLQATFAMKEIPSMV